MSTTEVVTPPCMVCGKESRIEVDAEAYRRWVRGALIQDAFPEMSDSERERLKTGTHPACWDAMFEGLEDEEDDDAT